MYFALLEPGDTVLGMSLSNGGHLTHGSPVNLSGKYFHFVAYNLDEKTERIDYDEVRRLALEHKPKLIVAGASAYARAIDFARFRQIADEVGALLMVDMAHIAGLVAAGEHMSPVPYADVVTTTTHKTLRGPRGGLILCREQYAKAIDKAIFPGTQGGPLEHVIAAKAVCFKEAMEEDFAAYQHQIVLNAAAMAEQLIKRGVRLVSGGTDNHLMLIDLVDTEMTGKELERLLGEANITTNKNTVPRETRSPFVTSGLRVGTPAVTTRGMKEPEMVKIADMIADIIEKGEAAVEDVRARALWSCARPSRSMDKLETLFAEQAAFNASINKTRHLEDVTDDEWVQKFALALIVEAGELLDAAHFQWWKNPRPIDREHLKEEAVDVFHFAVSVALAAGMDAQELFERYQSKNRENIARQQGLSSKPGYDVHELEP